MLSMDVSVNEYILLNLTVSSEHPLLANNSTMDSSVRFQQLVTSRVAKHWQWWAMADKDLGLTQLHSCKMIDLMRGQYLATLINVRSVTWKACDKLMHSSLFNMVTS